MIRDLFRSQLTRENAIRDPDHQLPEREITAMWHTGSGVMSIGLSIANVRNETTTMKLSFAKPIYDSSPS